MQVTLRQKTPGFFKEHNECRKEERALTAGRLVMGKWSEGTGRSRAEMRGASGQGHKQPHFPGSATDELISA